MGAVWIIRGDIDQISGLGNHGRIIRGGPGRTMAKARASLENEAA
jgi:hypothetical protein